MKYQLPTERTGYTYLGIDETSLGFSGDSLLVVMAETQNRVLALDKGYRALRKSQHFLQQAQRERVDNLYDLAHYPSEEEMRTNGLERHVWMRATGGRFSRHIVEHATIAQMVLAGNYDPEKTVLLIDGFSNNYDRSERLITAYLHQQGFPIPRKHVQVHGEGDCSIPIINYADLLAFQIGVVLSQQHHHFQPNRKTFPFPISSTVAEPRLSHPPTPKVHALRKQLEETLQTA